MSRFIAVARHRLTVDGDGVTTLVCFYGCTLRCKYCINARCFGDVSESFELTPEELYDWVKCDHLYFVSTGGGVCFGGGEPLLYVDYIETFKKLCPSEWKFYCESALNVDTEAVKKAARLFDSFLIDCKDTNPEIYERYTGKDNKRMLENLKLLVDTVGADKITVRLPLIPEYNRDSDRDKSEALLREIGIVNFDRFEYKICNQK